MADSNNERTSAATKASIAARRKAANERKAAFLRDEGYIVLPPEQHQAKPMKMIEIMIVDGLYFTAYPPCGKSWPGMRHTEDVRIVTDRVMDHVDNCKDCKCASTTPKE